jgi:hypothetical protein
MSVQPEFACIPSYPRAFAFPLALPQAAHARDGYWKFVAGCGASSDWQFQRDKGER